MTKKDYIKFAGMFLRTKPIVATNMSERTISSVCMMHMWRQIDINKFYSDCGYTQE